MKYAKAAGAVRWSEGWITLRRGQSIENDHPLAIERPDLFDDVEPGAEIQGGFATSRVESGMTSGPGSQSVRVEKPPVVKAPPRGSAQ